MAFTKYFILLSFYLILTLVFNHRTLIKIIFLANKESSMLKKIFSRNYCRGQLLKLHHFTVYLYYCEVLKSTRRILTNHLLHNNVIERSYFMARNKPLWSFSCNNCHVLSKIVWVTMYFVNLVCKVVYSRKSLQITCYDVFLS